MIAPNELNAIVERIASGTQTETDIESLRIALTNREQNVLQLGKYNVNIGQGQNVQIGDTVYPELNDEVIQAIAQYLFQKLQVSIQPAISQGVLPHSSEQNQLAAVDSVDALVQKVRSHCCEKIQHLYSKIQLLNRQLVDVNQLYVNMLLEKPSSESYTTITELPKSSISWDNFDRLGLEQRQKHFLGLELAAQSPMLVVWGKPGSGKSTFLRHLAVACCKGEFQPDHIPILIELRFIKDASQFNLLNCIHREFGLTDQGQTEQILNQGKVLILLDGLDEVPSQWGQDVQDHIYEFSQQYYKHRFILTCRTQTIPSSLPTFEYYELANFNREQVEVFAQNYFEALAETPELGAELKAQFMAKLRLPENKQTAELTITPIRLSLTCLIFNDLKDLPLKRSSLYEQGINLLLNKWDERRGIRREVGSEIYRKLSLTEKHNLLTYVAVRKFEKQQYLLFEQSEIQEYITEYLGISIEDSQAVLKALEVQHGLLIEQAQHIYSFSHLTFQEYFIAKWFVECADWEGLLSHVAKPHWREVFLLATNILNNASDFMQLMGHQVNELLAADEKLQQFLSWGNQKSCSIEFSCETAGISYKPAAIRAFYHGLAIKVNYYVKVFVYHASFNQDAHTVTAFDIANSIEPNFAALALDDMSQLLNYSLNPSSGGIAALVFDHTFSVILVNAFPRAPEPDIVTTFLRDLYRSCEPHSELKRRLSELRKQLPPSSEQEHMWWKNNGQSWTDKLRTVMIEHRNIGHDWQFSDEQKKRLQQYYDANKLLVDCLNSDCAVSDKVRNEIKEKLLLPIADLEKQEDKI